VIRTLGGVRGALRQLLLARRLLDCSQF